MSHFAHFDFHKSTSGFDSQGNLTQYFPPKAKYRVHSDGGKVYGGYVTLSASFTIQ